MKPELLIRDPVFKLNLLLWMAKEQPPKGYVVKALFFENGFNIIYIEQPFPFPPETLDAIEKSNKEISKEPEPELLLGRMPDRKALYFEAKSNSFSPESGVAKQARGHLLAVGDAFAEVLAPLQNCLLCYVVPAENCGFMQDCLQELAADLSGAALKPGSHSSHGLAVEGADLRYSWDAPFQQHVGIVGDSAIVMSGLVEDTDPIPLLLIYTDEDYPDADKRDLLRRCVVNQVHALLVCDLNRLAPNDAYQRSAESMLVDMTDGLFRYLGRKRQKAMRRLVTENVLRRIADFCRERFPGAVVLEGQQLKIRFPDAGIKSSFLDLLEDFSRTRFETRKPHGEKTMFDEIEGAEDG